MVTVEVRDISKLAGIIMIPSMSEGADTRETTAQRILYSGLPNQCRKCRRFGHLARTCPHNRLPAQEGNTSAKPPPPKGAGSQHRERLLARSVGDKQWPTRQKSSMTRK
jgi:hypothetical protein